ncbi:Neural cell adhesion molecule L1-like protein, partial [Galemys pyrenaicus]
KRYREVCSRGEGLRAQRGQPPCGARAGVHPRGEGLRAQRGQPPCGARAGVHPRGEGLRAQRGQLPCGARAGVHPRGEGLCVQRGLPAVPGPASISLAVRRHDRRSVPGTWPALGEPLRTRPAVPTITRQSTVQVAFPFDEVFLIECEATGNPAPTFSWTKDGKPFDLSDPRIVASNRSGTFRIPNEGHVAAFQGKYRCFAANRLGVAMSEEIDFVVPTPSGAGRTHVPAGRGQLLLCVQGRPRLTTRRTENAPAAVRARDIPKFPKEKIEPLEVEEGDPVVLPCSPPQGLPPLHIYWMNIALQHVEQDERVHVSRRGDLHFANVGERDSRSDYCCFAAFPRLRTIVQQMPVGLTVRSSNSIKQRKPRLLLPPAESGHESPVTVLKGHTLLLECFAEGLPTPLVEWKKVGDDLPQGRGTKESHGKVLKIESVSHRDRGSYRCSASNALGTATHDFHVVVEEPPRWTRKPQSSVYSQGSSGILLCEAAGEPKPTIRWRINGAPIEKNPFAGDVVSPGEISFTDLQPNHTAVYQCEASNAHGTILANANIDIVDVAPLIQTADEEHYAVVVGRGAMLHCQFFASPKAVKVEAARPLEGSRYVTHENGSLHIPSTSRDDAGAYSCWVENARGKTAVTATLDVHNATQLRVSPRSPRVARSHTLALHCSSSCDAHLRPSLRLSWSKDGAAFEANGTGDSRILIDGATLTVSNVTLQDQGAYSCSALTALDSAVDVTEVTVMDVPDPPVDLRLSDLQNRSVRLAWRAGDDHHSPVSEYIVEFEGNREEPGRWDELARVPGGETSATLPLAPYVRYQFRVLAVNEVGCSEPSRPSDHLETPPAAPDKNPENIRVQASQPKEMLIRWEVRAQAAPGPACRRTGLPAAAERAVSGAPSAVAGSPAGPAEPASLAAAEAHGAERAGAGVQSHLEAAGGVRGVGGGDGHQPHAAGDDFRGLRALRGPGPGSQPAGRRPRAALHPDAAPAVQGVEVVNSSVARVTWSTVPQDRVHGRLRGYQVCSALSWALWAAPAGKPPREAETAWAADTLSSLQVNWWKTRSLLDGRAHPKEVSVLRFPGQRNSGVVPSLEAFSEFHLTVLAFNSKGAGPESEPFVFQTPEGVPEQPTFLKVVKVDKDAATLSWGPPRRRNGNLTGYLLQYQTINGTYDVGELTDVHVTALAQPSWRLSQLNATTKYKFYVRACTARGCGKPVSEEGATLGEGKRGGLHGDLATQGWFVGLMCAVALLTLALLTVCFVRRNRGGKYSVKEKEDLHPDPEVQSAKDETFGDYSRQAADSLGGACAGSAGSRPQGHGGSQATARVAPPGAAGAALPRPRLLSSDSDEKPLKGSLRSLHRDLQAAPSADSLEDFGEGGPGLFGEDGSFIGAYAGAKEKGSVGSTGSSTATFPLRA